MPKVEQAALSRLREVATRSRLPYRFGATSDLARGARGAVVVVAACDDGSPAGPAELDWMAWAVSEEQALFGLTVEFVTGSRAEALDPETTAERLALLALVFADEVRANPATAIYRLTRSDLFADLPA